MLLKSSSVNDNTDFIIIEFHLVITYDFIVFSKFLNRSAINNNGSSVLGVLVLVDIGVKISDYNTLFLTNNFYLIKKKVKNLLSKNSIKKNQTKNKSSLFC